MKRSEQCAFPADSQTQTDGGMTIRQYAAIKAMQGILGMNYHSDNKLVAKLAIKFASELLSQLESK